jgi:hypothetical protein
MERWPLEWQSSAYTALTVLTALVRALCLARVRALRLSERCKQDIHHKRPRSQPGEASDA